MQACDSRQSSVHERTCKNRVRVYVLIVILHYLILFSRTHNPVKDTNVFKDAFSGKQAAILEPMFVAYRFYRNSI